MDSTFTTTIVSTSSAVITGIGGMFFTANQLGKRIDDVRVDIRELRSEFCAFKDVVNRKFSTLDTEIACRPAIATLASSVSLRAVAS